MRWLITGAGGMLGQDLCAVLTAAGETVSAARRTELDITDRAAVAAAVPGHDVVVNAAAWTDVDGAEAHEAEATMLNGVAPGYLAAACAETGAALVQISTDYVFDGTAAEAYPEDAPTAPINAYGRGKLAGEITVLEALPERGYVVRTAWLYAAHGKNFVRTMRRLGAGTEPVTVVDDQYGQPTWTVALARQLLALGRGARAGTAPPGVYHGTASGRTSWYGLAQAVFEQTGLDPARVRPVTSARFPRPAKRPQYSVLGHDRWQHAGIPVQPDWRSMLAEAL